MQGRGSGGWLLVSDYSSAENNSDASRIKVLRSLAVTNANKTKEYSSEGPLATLNIGIELEERM